MIDQNWITELYASIDEKNLDKFSTFLSEDCTFRFGNLPEVHGLKDTREYVAAFLDSIYALKHDISDTWIVPDAALCHGTVSYIRHDNSVLSVPFSTIFKIENDKIYEYLIFADTSELYNP